MHTLEHVILGSSAFAMAILAAYESFKFGRRTGQSYHKAIGSGFLLASAMSIAYLLFENGQGMERAYLIQSLGMWWLSVSFLAATWCHAGGPIQCKVRNLISLLLLALFPLLFLYLIDGHPIYETVVTFGMSSSAFIYLMFFSLRKKQLLHNSSDIAALSFFSLSGASAFAAGYGVTGVDFYFRAFLIFKITGFSLWAYREWYETVFTETQKRRKELAKKIGELSKTFDDSNEMTKDLFKGGHP